MSEFFLYEAHVVGVYNVEQSRGLPAGGEAVVITGVGFDAAARGLEAKLNTEATSLGLDKPIRLERVEAVKARERTAEQNLDVYNPPTLLDESVPLEIRKRDAQRAAETIPALARQNTADGIASMARVNQRRYAEGLLTRAEANAAQKNLRAAYERALRPESGPASQVDNLRRALDVATDDQSIDEQMGVDLDRVKRRAE